MATNNGNVHAFAAIDIEQTGVLYGDVLVGVGWAIGTFTVNSDNQVVVSEVTKGSVCLNHGLDLTDYPTILKEWVHRGYEERCLREFWQDKLDTLRALQDPKLVNLVNSEEDLANALNKALSDAEAMYGRVTILVNTIAFDTVLTSVMLMKYGFPGLQYSRKGAMQRGVELNSYSSGSLLLLPTDSRSDQGLSLKKKIAPVPKSVVVHDHDPKNDAHSILLTYFNTLKYVHAFRGTINFEF